MKSTVALVSMRGTELDRDTWEKPVTGIGVGKQYLEESSGHLGRRIEESMAKCQS